MYMYLVSPRFMKIGEEDITHIFSSLSAAKVTCQSKPLAGAKATCQSKSYLPEQKPPAGAKVTHWRIQKFRSAPENYIYFGDLWRT